MRRLFGVGLVRKLRQHRLLGVRCIWSSRHWLFGAIGVCCSPRVRHSRLAGFSCVGSSGIEHGIPPENRLRGRRRGDPPITSAPCTFPEKMMRLANASAMVKIDHLIHEQPCIV
jgi:hypothetical protein